MTIDKTIEVHNPQERRTTYTGIALSILGGGILLGAATIYGLHILGDNERDYQRQLKELRTIPVIEYVVQEGECLGTIAQRFTHGLDIDKVVDKTCELNPEINKETKIIKTGQTIRVPYNIVDNKIEGK